MKTKDKSDYNNDDNDDDHQSNGMTIDIDENNSNIGSDDGVKGGGGGRDKDKDDNDDQSKESLLTHFTSSHPHHQPQIINIIEQEQKHQEKMIKIIMVIFFYFFISITLVFSNKILMKNYDFQYPLFITWYQQVVSFLLVWFFCKISPSFSALSFLPQFEFKSETAYKVLPLTGILTGMIVFNNLCLKYVEVSFYQVARSLSLCFSLILTYVILKTKTSTKSSIGCLIVFFGFVLGSLGEANFSWLGLLYGTLSSFFVALYSVYVKRILPSCDNNEWKLSIYNTALSIGIILPLTIMVGEFKTLWYEPIVYTLDFWIVMTIAGIMGYLISIAVFMQIKHTSPLTNSISATLKACLQTILAVMIWNNEITFQNGIGIVLVIGGSFYYSYTRYQEMRK